MVFNLCTATRTLRSFSRGSSPDRPSYPRPTVTKPEEQNSSQQGHKGHEGLDPEDLIPCIESVLSLRPPRPCCGNCLSWCHLHICVRIFCGCGYAASCTLWLCGESVPCAPKRIYSFQWKNGFSASYWSGNRRLEDLVSSSNVGLISCFSTGCATRKWFNKRFRRGWSSTLMREWLGSELCRFA
jgi:hypothetical protein